MLLCAETSSPLGSLCAVSNDGKLTEIQWEKKSSHSEVITTTYSTLQTQHGFSSKELTTLAVDVGPGSFTGIRVGLSFIKTLAYSFNLQTACFNSFDVMAFQHDFEGSALFTLPAVTNHVYAAGFKRSGSNLECTMVPSSKSTQEIQILNGQYNHHIDGSAEGLRPKASTIAHMMRQKSRSITYVSWKDINPLYLRRSEAEEKLETGLLKPIYSR